MHSSLTVVSFGQRRKVTAAMEPKVTCVLVMVFALALSSLAQGEAGKTPPFLLCGGHAGQGSASGSHGFTTYF